MEAYFRPIRESQCGLAPFLAGFRRALAVMALEPHRPVALRQLAAVLLKQSLSPDLVASVSNEEIEEIKALILQGLSDPTSKLRTAVVRHFRGHFFT
jgi:hypothetical protein